MPFSRNDDRAAPGGKDQPRLRVVRAEKNSGVHDELAQRVVMAIAAAVRAVAADGMPQAARIMLDHLHAATPQPHGRIALSAPDCFAMALTAPVVPRAITLVRGLVPVLLAMGYDIAARAGGACVVADGCEIQISVRTPGGARAGRLQVTVGHAASQTGEFAISRPRVFADQATVPAEDRVADIVMAIAEIPVSLHLFDELKGRRPARRRRDGWQPSRANVIDQREVGRDALVNALLTTQRQRQELCDLLQALPDPDQVHDPHFAALITHLKRCVAVLDQRLSADTIVRDGDLGDLFDPE